jgi:hypothetical protein
MIQCLFSDAAAAYIDSIPARVLVVDFDSRRC